MKLSKVIDLLRGPRKRGEAVRLMGGHPCSLAKWDRECIVVNGVVYRRTGLQLPPIDPQLQAERLAALRGELTVGAESLPQHSTTLLGWFNTQAPLGLDPDSFNRYYLGLDIDGSTRLTGAEWLAVISQANALNK